MSTHVQLLGLGMIPDWQFSLDPVVNPKINPFVTYPAGVYQTTPQSWGPYYGQTTNKSAGVAGPQIKLFGPALGFSNPFDSWGWRNRKWIAFGGLGVVGLGALAAVTAILR
jgi:hypothetical protein